MWVRYRDGRPTKVVTDGLDDVDDLCEAIKKKFSPKFDGVATSDLIVSSAGAALRPSTLLSTLAAEAGADDGYNALVVTVAAAARECPCRAPVVAALCACVCARASLTLRRASHCRRRRGWCR